MSLIRFVIFILNFSKKQKILDEFWLRIQIIQSALEDNILSKAK